MMEEGDPTSPLNLSQSNNLDFYVSRNHSLATRVDDVLPNVPFTAHGDYLGRTNGVALDLRTGRFAKGEFRAENPWRGRECTGQCRMDSAHDCWYSVPLRSF